MHDVTHGRRRPMIHLFHGRSTRFYDFVARRVARRMYRRFAADIATVAPEGAAVLDVGTGPGVLLVELARRRPDLRLTGVDLSADMIAFAGRNLGGRGEVRVGDVADLPFEDGSFDLIVSSLSLHHWESPSDAVPELARVLRPGGRVLIYDFPGAPFTALADAAWNASVLNGAAPQTTPVRTGLWFIQCVRYALSA